MYTSGRSWRAIDVVFAELDIIMVGRNELGRQEDGEPLNKYWCLNIPFHSSEMSWSC